jgi:hypothetical protein
MRELYRSAFCLLTIDEERAIIRRVRTSQRFETIEVAKLAYDGVLQAVEGLDLARYGLLSDVREAPARNDPAFEQLLTHYYPRMFGSYRRMAVLVRTEAGRLHVARLSRLHARPIEVFSDERLALTYLEVRDDEDRPLRRPARR